MADSTQRIAGTLEDAWCDGYAACLDHMVALKRQSGGEAVLGLVDRVDDSESLARRVYLHRQP